MKKLTDIQTVRYQGSVTQIARLPLQEPDPYWSEFVAFNGDAEDYEIRFRIRASEINKI